MKKKKKLKQQKIGTKIIVLKTKKQTLARGYFGPNQ